MKILLVILILCFLSIPLFAESYITFDYDGPFVTVDGPDYIYPGYGNDYIDPAYSSDYINPNIGRDCEMESYLDYNNF